jgi:hypothetical protein
VDASCVWRWVQAYAAELNKRCRPHLKPTNKSYRIDETYIKVKGQDKYLYRAFDSTGQTIDFPRHHCQAPESPTAGGLIALRERFFPLPSSDPQKCGRV